MDLNSTEAVFDQWGCEKMFMKKPIVHYIHSLFSTLSVINPIVQQLLNRLTKTGGETTDASVKAFEARLALTRCAVHINKSNGSNLYNSRSYITFSAETSSVTE